jgi:hypothetical protein
MSDWSIPYNINYGGPMKPSLFFITTLFLSGCIIEENADSLHPKQDPYGIDDPSNPSEDVRLDTGEAIDPYEEMDPLSFTLIPHETPPDSMYYAILRADTEFDWGDIETIHPYGPIEICNMRPLYDELILGIQIDHDADDGYVDLVIEYTNGDIDYLENAVKINKRADHPEFMMESCK